MKLCAKNIVGIVAGGIAIVCFFMMFMSPIIRLVNFNEVMHLNFHEVYFEHYDAAYGARVGGAGIPFLAFMLVLFFGIVVILMSIFNNKYSNTIIMAACAVFFVCGILFFCTRMFFATEIFSAVKTADAGTFYANHGINAGPIIAGILALGACVVSFVARFMKQK